MHEEVNLVHVMYDMKSKNYPMNMLFPQKPDSLLEAKLKLYRPTLKFVWTDWDAEVDSTQKN